MRHDQEAKNLFEVIQNGWPDRKKDLPDNNKSYFSFHDILSFEKKILKGECLFISKKCHSFFKNQLHKDHLGYASMMHCACDTIFWLGMSKKLNKLPITV